MGGGDFGSNGSVHWDISDTSAPANGVDNAKRHPGGPPDPRPVIGAPPHPTTFRVTLRFASIAAAQQALSGASLGPSPGGGGQLVLLVPVRGYQPQPGPKNQWEVSVDW